MRTARRVFQILFLLLFLVLFLLATFPFETRVPVDLFLRLDPLSQFSAVVASRVWIPKAAVSLVLVALTLLLGRFFCGWICPLGTSIDAFDNAVRAKSKNEQKRNSRWLKYAILLVCLIAALFSVQLAGFLDPIPLFTRSVTTALYPVVAFWLQSALDSLGRVGFLESAVSSVDAFLHGFLLPVTAAAFRGGMLIGLMFIGILLLGLIQRRTWCRNLCPLGALLGLFSVWRPYRRVVQDACTSCNLCRRICRAGAIREDFRQTDHAECINCMDCKAVCPADAVRFRFVRKPRPSPVDFSRRRMMGAGLSGLFALGLVKTGFRNPVRKGQVVRPPGAIPEPGFLDRCVRCGECVRICASSGQGLHHAGLESGWEGLASPVLIPPKGYCEYNCNLCGQVCPTGAIKALSITDKQLVKMGTAHFDKTHCIPWYYGENCMVCEEHCPIPEKAIKFRESRVTMIDGRESTVLLPYVVEESCVGCGICSCRCPVEGIKGIYVTNAGEQRG
jgi:polyferredoxin